MKTPIPQEVIDYARGYACEENGYEYADNFRFYTEDNEELRNEYNSIRAGGCCGYADDIEVPFLVDGKRWFFGFNYGH